MGQARETALNSITMASEAQAVVLAVRGVNKRSTVWKLPPSYRSQPLEMCGSGGLGATAESALNRLRRPPETVLPFRLGRRSTVAMRTAFTCMPLKRLPDRPCTIAAAPATWGVAMLVPLMLLYPIPLLVGVKPRGQVLTMADPGAPRSTLFLKKARNKLGISSSR